MKRLTFLLLATTISVTAQQKTIPPGYWTEEQSAKVLEKVGTIRLAPDLSRLTPGERAALDDLLNVGQIFQDLYEDARHHQALRSRAELMRIHENLERPKWTQNLLDLYRLWSGPIVTTLDNKREAFVPVDPQVPARNVYPIDSTKEEIEKFLASHPEERASILGERTVVRRASKENLERDLATLRNYPAIDILHPRLGEKLTVLLKNVGAGFSPLQDGLKPVPTFYAVPYPVAWAKDLTRAYGLLRNAADKIEESDEELAIFLRNRARDLLTNDYESGDAAWVTGRFKNLNGQIGAYETYDDPMFGVKAFHATSLLISDGEATSRLRQALGGLQAIEDALPYQPHKRVKEDIPVGVYDVIADFGQARGTNTATILPNDPLYSRRYGRTILLRRNIMEHPEIFAGQLRTFRAATVDAHADDLKPVGNTQRTLWHEIGHYLGPDRDKAGRTLDIALEDYADAIEEMKSDLVSLFAHHQLHDKRMLDDATLRAVHASGILRTLQNVQPRRDQPYQTMQLIQFNWFLENGLLAADPQTARLTIRYSRYRDVTNSLLKEVLALQANGDQAAAARFFDRWTKWTPELHERLAERIRQAQGVRWRIVRYAALGE